MDDDCGEAGIPCVYLSEYVDNIYISLYDEDILVNLC